MSKKELSTKGRMLLIIYSVGLVILLFQPFRFMLPFYSGNSANWQEAKVAFPAPGLVRSAEPAEKLVHRLTKARSFSIELVVTSYSDQQTGDPSRIFTLSNGINNHNFVVGQHLRDLVIKIRTVHNVYSDLVAVAHRFPNVDILAPYKDPHRKDLGRDPNQGDHLIMIRDFFTSGMKKHIMVSFDGRTLSIFSNDKVYFSGIARDEQFLKNWDNRYFIYLGNEGDGSQSWLGEIEAFRVFGKALTMQDTHYIRYSSQQKHKNKIPSTMTAEFRIVGDTPEIWLNEPHQTPVVLGLVKPEMSVYLTKEFLSISGREILSLDTVANVLLFVPFGIFITLRNEKDLAISICAAVKVGSFAFLLSFLVEISQFFIETRHSSLNDVLSNVVGAIIGWLFLTVLLREKLDSARFYR